MRPWPDDLADPGRLRAAIDRLIERRRGSGAVTGLPGLLGPAPRALLLERDRFARLLGDDVRRRAHVLGRARVRRARLDKERELYAFGAADLVLHGAFAELLTERMEPSLSPRLYSYRRGRSSLAALADFVAYLRAHARAHEPRRRGLFVYHCDVRAYGESIPVGDGAPLWADLRGVLGDADDAAWALARGLVRPEVEGAGAGARAAGLPTGSPVATALANLYLGELDRALEAVPGAFSARYGDDLLLAHPSSEVVAAAATLIDGRLAARGLEVNAAKRQLVWLTGSGRPAAEARGAQHVVFLGLEVAFRGTLALPRAKERELLADLRERARRAARLCRDLGEDERGRAVGAALAAALDPRSPLAAPHADVAAGVISDRGRLAHLDHLIALLVAEAVTGTHGVRAFRAAPPRRQRTWAVPSLVARRNRR